MDFEDEADDFGAEELEEDLEEDADEDIEEDASSEDDEDEEDEEEEENEGEEEPEEQEINSLASKIATYSIENTSAKLVEDHKRQSPPILFIYERTRIIGCRAEQIARTGKVFCDMPAHIKAQGPIAMATYELMQKKSPIAIRRPLPNGLIEKYKLSELTIF